MAVVNPNLQDSPTFDAQAVRDSVDLSAMVGSGAVVVSGMVVSPSSAMVIAIAAGAVSINGTTYNYAGGTATVTAASTSDRRDTVIYTAGTGVQVIAGTPCGLLAANWLRTTTSNNPPVKQLTAIPANSVILAEAYVGYATTTVAAGNLVDKRNVQAPLTGDVTTSGAAATLVGTTASQAVVRAAASQDIAERAGLNGAAAVLSGSLNNGVRSGIHDVVIGDSIGKGWGGTYGVTDWATSIATTENRAVGLPDPLFGFVACQNSLDGTQWSTLNVGANAGANIGPLPSISSFFLNAGSWKLSASSQVIGDQPITVGLCTTTTGSTAVSTTTAGGFTNGTGSFAYSGMLVTGTGIAQNTYVQGGAGATSSLVLSQPAIGSGTTLTFNRPFRRVKIYYQLQTNGASVTFATLGTVVSGTVATAGSGIGVWDSGDLGSPTGTGFTATAGAIAGSGATSAGVIIHGVRYYQNAGTSGATIDNFAVGGMGTAAFTNTIGSTGWATFMTAMAQTGNPYRRMYLMVGINNAQGNPAGYSTFQSDLTTIVTTAQAASPQTEVIIAAQHYGDTSSTYSCVTHSGTNIIDNATFASGVTGPPMIGSLVSGPGVPAGTTVTANSTGHATLSANCTASATVSLVFTQGRGGASNWTTNWVKAAAQVALNTGSAFVNLYERFGDISEVTTVPSVTTSSTTATAAANAFNNISVGMAVTGAGITNGTTVAAVNAGAGTMTLSAPVYTAGTFTLSFSYDTFGLGQASTPDIHFGDASQSFSGRDGQKAIAETFLNKLAYSNQAQSPSTLQSGTPADGKIVSGLSAQGPGVVTTSGYTNANDANPVWSLNYNSYFGLTPPGLYLGAGGAPGLDVAVTRGGASTTQIGSPLLPGALKVVGLTGATAGARWVGSTTGGAPASGTFLAGDWITTTKGQQPTATAVIAITNVARTTTTVTLTAANTLVAGATIVVNAVTNTSINGTWVVTSATATTIVYTDTTSGTIASVADTGSVVEWVSENTAATAALWTPAAYTAATAFQLSLTRNVTLYLNSANLAATVGLGPASGTTTTVAQFTNTATRVNAVLEVPAGWWVNISATGVNTVAVAK